MKQSEPHSEWTDDRLVLSLHWHDAERLLYDLADCHTPSSSCPDQLALAKDAPEGCWNCRMVAVLAAAFELEPNAVREGMLIA